ncbi:hypothetical protein [Corynebacterium camporealensis]
MSSTVTQSLAQAPLWAQIIILVIVFVPLLSIGSWMLMWAIDAVTRRVATLRSPRSNMDDYAEA